MAGQASLEGIVKKKHVLHVPLTTIARELRSTLFQV